MLDADLATLYGVTTKRLNQQFRRNHHTIPGRLCVSAHPGRSEGGCGFKVAKCNLKEGTAHQTRAARVHGAWRTHARQRSQQQSCGSGQHLRGSCVRTNARCTDGVRRSVPQNRRAGRHIRSSFPASLHRDSRPHGNSGQVAAHDRFSREAARNKGRRNHEHQPAPILLAFARSGRAIGLPSRRRAGNIRDGREGLRGSGQSCRPRRT